MEIILIINVLKQNNAEMDDLPAELYDNWRRICIPPPVANVTAKVILARIKGHLI